MMSAMDEATIAAYEAGAQSWRDRRPARFLDRVDAFAALVPADGVVADLGCGAGLHLPRLRDALRPGADGPAGLLAVDAAHAMLRLVPEVAPDALRVQADLARLPLRRGALGGGWARASYLHLPRTELPWALMELHHAVALGGVAHLTMLGGDIEGRLEDDQYPGRLFAHWAPDALHDVFVGAGFDVLELVRQAGDGDDWLHALVRRARTLPDIVGPDMRLLLCGLNPSVYSADVGVGFARPGNRFWGAALASGIVSVDRDARGAYASRGIGMTDLVKRATARADELAADEYRAGAARVERLVEWLQPGAICFVGLSGYRIAVDRRAVVGVQPEPFGGVPAYVMPNPSGINAHTNPADLAAHLRAAADLADRARDG
jgi:TDG/mug DNA glycosylase family protein